MLSNFVLFTFILGIALGAVLCLVGLATPGWFNLADDKAKNADWEGILGCFSRKDSVCEQIWAQGSDYFKATVALSVIGILAAVAAIVWSFIVCFACCCKTCLGPPLPIFATVAFACQLSACVIYGVKVKNIDLREGQTRDSIIEQLGYSYILTIVGAVVYFIDIFLGGLAVLCGEF